MDKKIVFIKRGKGGKERYSSYGESAYDALLDLLTVNNYDKEDLLFPMGQGNILNYIIKRWAKRAGIRENLHAHSFRHYHITESQKQGVPAEVVANQVGHESLTTTNHYTHFGTEFITEKYKECKI